MYISIIDWIESHPVTVDVTKWFLLLFFAWISGVFGYIRKKLRSQKIEVIEMASL